MDPTTPQPQPPIIPIPVSQVPQQPVQQQPLPYTVCSSCHIPVRPTDYFCFNCGKNLHPKPAATDVTTQFLYYLGSLALPPMGIIWGIRYLRDKNSKAKMVGIVMIVLTIVELIVAVQMTIQLVNSINGQVNKQLENIQIY